ncbi:hypothetical protein QLH51_07515 [Sphingomonas sp. 2R-10]|uniref:hypothetical protein n=1 Tax=Sphingomonas sp. 2R-10 TaxID=3045148 RepID=UPI0024B8E679|nr:hypothetical protein [Sphingomonas sp. 2R-10]MDJ0276639.1 hypothetical protein [Sphingomonas sp. 2R-10]
MCLAATLLLSACGGGEAPVEANIADAAAPVKAPVAPAIEATATPAAPAQEQSLDAFWTKFRAAALSNDAAAIAAMSAPVVMQHGDLDDSPKFRLAPEQVAPVVAKILDKNDGTSLQGRTHRQLLQAATSPPKDRSATRDDYRVGDLEFTRGANGWRLTALYYESYE